MTSGEPGAMATAKRKNINPLNEILPYLFQTVGNYTAGPVFSSERPITAVSPKKIANVMKMAQSKARVTKQGKNPTDASRSNS